jgi:hypothetical protein|nr:MAG TPA: hypothetical protein [Caudoviricetes sp.]
MEQEAIDSTLEVCFNSNYFCKLIKKVYYESKDNHEDFENKVMERMSEDLNIKIDDIHYFMELNDLEFDDYVEQCLSEIQINSLN